MDCTYRPPAFSFPSGLKSSACHPSSPHPSKMLSWIFQIQTARSASIRHRRTMQRAYSFHPHYQRRRGCRQRVTRRYRVLDQCDLGPMAGYRVAWLGIPMVMGPCVVKREARRKRPELHQLLVQKDHYLCLVLNGLTPPPDACQFTARYFPPAETTSVSHAEPLILTFS